MNISSDEREIAGGHTGLDPVTVDSLLEKLSTDDDFRAVFQANPAQALASLGADQENGKASPAPEPGDNYYCMTSTQLASKEEIAATRLLLQKHLAAAGNHNVIFCFEANKIRSALERS